MKKPSKSFSEQYPYLAYWIEDWGEMETTNGNWDETAPSKPTAKVPTTFNHTTLKLKLPSHF